MPSITVRVSRSFHITDTRLAPTDHFIDVHVSGIVLQRVRVEWRVRRIVLGELGHTAEFGAFGNVVVYGVVGHLRHVQETVEQVDGPVGRYGTGGEVPAVHAHGGVVFTVSVRGVADDGLGGGVVAAPVAAPAYLTAVLEGSAFVWHAKRRIWLSQAYTVRVVAAEQNVGLVRVQDGLVHAENLGVVLLLLAKVHLEGSVVGAVADSVLLGKFDDFPSLAVMSVFLPVDKQCSCCADSSSNDTYLRARSIMRR